MTNKEVERLACEAVEAHRRENAPFDHDSFVALVKMMRALYPHTTYEHQIDTVSRMKVLLDSVDGLRRAWKPEELFDACIGNLEAKPASFVMSLNESDTFIKGVIMALKRLDPKAAARPCLSALAQKL